MNTKIKTLSAIATCLIVLAGCKSSDPKDKDPNKPGPEPESKINLVDPDATDKTASLFKYLQEVSSTQLLFGHQHETTQGLTIVDNTSGQESDTKNAVGDYAAVYGWDTLSIVGSQSEGDIGIHVKEAYKRNGIITISTHLPNPTSGGDSWDTTRAVEHALPGGKDHEVFKGHLDEIAAWANTMVDDNGDPIPMIFRVLHENTGSWFWWGAAQSTPSEYKNLYRYVVDYLRDVKGIHQFLYAYSPSDTFGGSEELFLQRYPGDDYVDVIGFDSYGPGGTDNQAWFDSVIEASALVSRMAKARGKISAIAEIGISGTDIAAGNFDEDWYTTLMNGLKNHDEAKDVAYLLVWRNGSNDHFWVPVGSDAGDNSNMLPDFKAFYDDGFTAFNGDLGEVYSQETEIAEETRQAYLVTPTRLQKMAGSETVRARIQFGDAPAEVTLDIQDNGEVTLELNETDNQVAYYEGELTASDYTEDAVLSAALSVDDSDQDQVIFIIDDEPAVDDPNVVDQFENYFGLGELVASEYTSAGDFAEVSLSTTEKEQGDYGLLVNYQVGGKGYAGINHGIAEYDWRENNTLSFWFKPDANQQRLVIQLVANGVNWEAYRILGDRAEAITQAEVNPKYGDAGIDVEELTTTGYVEIPFGEFIKANWENAPGDFNPTSISKLSFYVNGVNNEQVASGQLALDDIQGVFVTGNGDYSNVQPPAANEKLSFNFDSDTTGDWTVHKWGGSADATLNHNGDAMVIVPTWGNAVQDKLAVERGLGEEFDISGGSLTMDVYVPAAYLAMNGDASFLFKVFVRDKGSNYGNFGDFNGSSLTGDAWNTLTFTDIDVDTFGWTSANFDLTTLTTVGLELASNTVTATGDILVDNIELKKVGHKLDFSEASQVTSLATSTWGGTVTAALSHDAVNEELVIEPTWGALNDKLVVTQGITATDLTGRTLKIDIELPEDYINDGNLGIQLFAQDTDWTYANFGWNGMGNFTAGEKLTLTYSNISPASLGFDGGIDLTQVQTLGIEFVANNKPVAVTGNILVDNWHLTP